MKVGIADTTFARYDMAKAAIRMLKAGALSSDSQVHCAGDQGPAGGRQEADRGRGLRLGNRPEDAWSRLEDILSLCLK